MQRYTTHNLKKEKAGSILVAAQTIPFMHNLTRFVVEAGFEILHTPNAVHAMKILNMMPVKLILIDCNIPKGENLQLLHMIKENFGMGMPPIIYMYDPNKNTVNISEIMHLGVKGVLTLPLDFEEAKAKITQVLTETHGI